MRTTMTLDPSIYQMLKELARHNKESIGKTASRLIRQAVQTPPSPAALEDGFPTLPETGQSVPVTSHDVYQIAERLGL